MKFRNARKKKSSISGGAKKLIAAEDELLLLDRNFGATLGFIGAGGHDKISVILNFLPFGVQQPAAAVGAIGEA